MNLSTQDNYAVFEETVKNNFSFLVQQYGFRLSQIEQTGYVKVIRYESPLVYVSLIYGPPAYEPEMAFGRIGIDDVPGNRGFHPGDLVLLRSSFGWKWGAVNPKNPVLVEIVAGHAQILRECGSACLLGDQASFEEMKARRDNAIEDWHQEEKVNSIRNDAQVAWESKDYRAVLRLLESIETMLTDTEKKKLEYAKKQLSF
jgi:hypothetical protein